MVEDKIDKLASGKKFNSRTAVAVKNETFFQLKLYFDTSSLQYCVKLSIDSDSTVEVYDSQSKAKGRYETVKIEHDLTE
jgi:hypothetical protein